MAVALACFAVFLVMAALMYTRRISALLALPIMAVAIALVGGIPADRILTDVLAKGSVKLSNAYTTTIFGAILAELINKLGIAKSLVRWVAEFAGDSPFLLGLFMTLVTALLFTSLGGLGAVIMVGTVVLPVMLSLGISPLTAGGLFLFGINLGGMFNLANWQLYVEVLKIDQSAIAAYVVPFAAAISAIVLMFLTIELKTWRNISYLLIGLLLLGGAFGGLTYMQQQSVAHAMAAAAATNSAVTATTNGANSSAVATSTASAAAKSAASAIDPVSITITGAVLSAMILYAIYRHSRKEKSLPGIAFITPAIPLLLVLAGHWDIIPAFLVGITFAVLSTWQRDSVNTLTRSIIEGAGTVAPAVVLMFGIGMLLAAVMDPTVSSAIAPLLVQVVPTQPIPYVLVFTAAAVLALYRGPLSIWGMGSGVVKLMQTSTALGATAIMSMLMSVGQLQGVCDPTNTHNVWIATYLGTDTQSLLKRTLPYAWLAVFSGLVLAVALGYVRSHAG